MRWWRRLLGMKDTGTVDPFALVERRGEVVSRDEIMDEVWGDDTFPSTRTIDNFIVRLRRLFEPDPSAPVHFHTVWGVGYRFTPDAGRGAVGESGEYE